MSLTAPNRPSAYPALSHKSVHHPRSKSRYAFVWCLLVTALLGWVSEATASGPAQLTSVGTIWYNPATATAEELTPATGGDSSPILYQFMKTPVGGSGLTAIGQLSTTKTLFIPYEPNMEITRCATRTTCWTGAMSSFIESAHVPMTPPACSTAITLSPVSLPAAIAGVAYSQTLTVAGGLGGPYTVELVSGLLPSGFTLTSSGSPEWTLAGTTYAGNAVRDFSLKVTDATNYCNIIIAFSFQINCSYPLSGIVTNFVPGSCSNNGTPGDMTDDFVLADVTVSYGAPALSGTLSVSSGVLHPSNSAPTVVSAASLGGTTSYTFTGLRFRANGSSGAIDAEFSDAGYGCSFTVPVALPNACSSCPAISLSGPSVSSLTQGIPVTVALTASGGTAPYTFQLTGALPSGLSAVQINSTTLELSGTPTALGNFSFGYVVTDSVGCGGTQSFSGTVVCPTLSLGPVHAGTPVVGQVYSFDIDAAGGTPSYTYGLSGTLPPGLSLDAATGIISGTPTTAGAYSFSITVQDTLNCSGSRSYVGTVDAAPVCGLGNVVFVDRDGDGRFDPGEGCDGIRVELFSAAGVFLFTMDTAGGGCYLFSGLAPGSYFVKIPNSQFTGTGKLAGYISWPGNGGDTQTDDATDENGIDDPAYLTNGIRSADITLAANTEPTGATGETGKDPTLDDADDDNTDLTIDFGFRKPATYCEFVLAQNLIGADALPIANPDGDLYTNVLEFLFCYPPKSGLNPGCPLSLTLNPDQTIDICLRGVTGVQGTTPSLQATASLTPTAWVNVGTAIVPVVSQSPDGLSLTCWRNVELTPGLAAGQGFFRASFTVDTDCNGSQELTTATPVMGFQDRRINTQCETCSNPFLKCELFAGQVDSNTLSGIDVTISAGGKDIKAAMVSPKVYFIEVVSGPLEGHRLLVDQAASTASHLAIVTNTPLTTTALTVNGLTGARIVVREFWQLLEQFPASLYLQGSSQATADYALFYENGAWQTYYLSVLGGGRWVKVGSGGTSFNEKIIDPCRGLFIHRQDGPGKTERPLDIVLSGWVRQTKFACPLAVGSGLVSGGWPIHQSLSQRAMLLSDGFSGAGNQIQADRVYRWKADADWTWPKTQENYQTFWLLNASASLRYWTQTGLAALPNKNIDTTLFLSGHSVFVSLRLDHSSYVMPSPWVP
jgi:Putative Ig domain/SdrD B-like domain